MLSTSLPSLPIIVFGGLFFWLSVLVFLIILSSALYSNWEGTAFIAAILFAIGFWLTLDQYPQFNYWYLLAYPICAALWLPMYWWLALKRRADYVKLKYKGSLKEAYHSYDNSKFTGRLAYVSSVDENADGTTTDRYSLSHPPKDELTANAIFFFVSIPVTLAEDFIARTIEVVTSYMNKVRDRISAGLDQ